MYNQIRNCDGIIVVLKNFDVYNNSFPYNILNNFDIINGNFILFDYCVIVNKLKTLYSNKKKSKLLIKTDYSY